MNERYDIAIVGAGPAGGLVASLAARQGASVLLVDKARFPRAKVCGCCLNAEALNVLERAGLGGLTAQLTAQPLHALRIGAAGRQATLRLPGGAAVSRAALDHALAAAAVAGGATFRDETTATVARSVHDGEPWRSLTLRSRGGEAQTVAARVVVAADGLAGTCLGEAARLPWCVARRSRVGLGAIAPAQVAGDYEPGVIHMACGASGYVGLVRLEDGRLDIAAAADLAFVQAAGGPAGAAAKLLQDAGWPSVAGMDALPWRGTPALTRARRTIGGPGLFVVGDATGYVEPFTGEGMAWALRGAEAVTPLALAAVRGWTPTLARQWARTHRRLFALRRVRCRLIASLLRRPRLVRFSAALLGRHPELAGPLTRRIAVGT
ncbi:MAG: FAD-dependent monooxygenase [Phycisphaeraceae bacterium]